MKSKIIIFAIICTLLLLMLPNLNAIEFREVKNSLESRIAIDYNFFNLKFENSAIYSLFSIFIVYYYIFCFIITFNYLVTRSLDPWSGSDPMPPFKAFVASFFFVIITMLIIPIQILLYIGFEGPIIIMLFYIVILIFEIIMFIMENLEQLFGSYEIFEKNHFPL